MTFEDMKVVETHVADLHAGGLPVMLSTEYDRVDVDARKLSCGDAVDLVDRLAQSLGRKGYIWDVWVETSLTSPVNRVVHVAEREEAG
jgi:hypothetical protein